MKPDKWVLVTGGSRGIGESVVKHLADKYNVVFTWLREEEQARALESECAQFAGKVIGFRCDGTCAAQVDTLAANLLSEHGAPFGIIHNAGITRDALHFRQTSKDWHAVINTNLNAIFHWNQALLPAMMTKSEGSIVMMSSVSAIKGNAGQVAYAATKAAMLGMTRSLAKEVARFNLRVNSVLPGLIETEMVQVMAEAEKKILRKGIPMRRFGRKEEVSQVVGFLLSDGSSYITGQSLVVDGGITI